MQLATGGDMLNFGYWDGGGSSNRTGGGPSLGPVAAQSRMCSLVGDVAELKSARRLVDVGSGFSAPAIQWKSAYEPLDISCVNINFRQLAAASKSIGQSKVPHPYDSGSHLYRHTGQLGQAAATTTAAAAATTTTTSLSQPALPRGQTGKAGGISLLNATSAALPFADRSVDRVVALESAQHFRSLDRFVRESRRILEPGGLLVIAMPVLMRAIRGPFGGLSKLGILSLTWSSEHYSLDYVKATVAGGGFAVADRDAMQAGHHVYEPLAEYYISNRKALRQRILAEYPSYLESILYRSLGKMKEASEKQVIGYVILKARAEA